MLSIHSPSEKVIFSETGNPELSARAVVVGSRCPGEGDYLAKRLQEGVARLTIAPRAPSPVQAAEDQPALFAKRAYPEASFGSYRWGFHFCVTSFANLDCDTRNQAVNGRRDASIHELPGRVVFSETRRPRGHNKGPKR